jgi:hypothetical protein
MNKGPEYNFVINMETSSLKSIQDHKCKML